MWLHVSASVWDRVCAGVGVVCENSLGNLPSEGLRAGAVKGFLFTDPIKALFAKQ